MFDQQKRLIKTSQHKHAHTKIASASLVSICITSFIASSRILRKRAKATRNTEHWEEAARPARALARGRTERSTRSCTTPRRDIPRSLHRCGARAVAATAASSGRRPAPARAAPNAGSPPGPVPHARPAQGPSPPDPRRHEGTTYASGGSRGRDLPPGPGRAPAPKPPTRGQRSRASPHHSPGSEGEGPSRRAAAGGGKRGVRPGRRPPTAHGGCGGAFRSAAARCAPPRACAPPRPQPHLAARCARRRREAHGSSLQPLPRAAPGGALRPRIAGQPLRAVTGRSRWKRGRAALRAFADPGRAAPRAAECCPRTLLGDGTKRWS